MVSALLLIPPSARAAEQEAAPRQPLRLEDLERLAVANNPTIAQAAAAVRAAEGRKRQAGLLPNPVLGYEGSELTIYKDKFKLQTEHIFFLEQRLVTGRKLKRRRQVFEHAHAEAQADAQAQRQRVINAVRILYYDVLGAERLVEVRRDLARLTGEAVAISEELFNIGQADQPDLLQAEIEAQRAELDLRRAENERRSVRQVLGVVVGDASVAQVPLEGNIEAGLPLLEPEQTAARLIRESPQMKAAQSRILRARASIERERAHRIGDVIVRGGLGFNFDRAHGTGGWVGEASIAFPLPLFDRNQGAIASARAEADEAELDAKRLELALRARLASAFERYASARDRAESYRTAIIPRAEKAYRLYLERFREMAAAYPQVLIAQRTLFQARAELLMALGEAWHEAALIDGFLLTGGFEAPDEMHRGDFEGEARSTSTSQDEGP
jgi:cobalt-zinc-cadmium efflux system outer membrane protein